MKVTEALLEFWYQAKAAKFGIELIVSDSNLAKQRLYKARADAKDPLLNDLQIRTSPVLPESHLWIVKGKPNGPS